MLLMLDVLSVPADNLECCGSDYYQQRTLHFTIGCSDPFYKQCFAETDQPETKRQKQ